MGLLYGFFIAIICGQRISNRHYHVLAKQELTKVFSRLLFHVLNVSLKIMNDTQINCLPLWFSQEYVIENLIDGEEAPPLDRAHLRELQMLGLYHDKDEIPDS